MVRLRTAAVFVLPAFLALSAGCSSIRNALGAARAAVQLATRQTTSFSLDDLKADCKRPEGAAEILMPLLVPQDPNDKDLALFNAAYCQDLSLRVTRLPEVREQVPGWVADEVMKQQGLAKMELAPAEAMKVARLTGRRHALSGAISRVGDKLRMRIEVFDAKSDKAVGAPIELAGTPQELLDGEGRLAEQIAQRVGVKLSDADRAWLNRPQFRDADDLAAVAQLMRHEGKDHKAKLAARREEQPYSLLVEMEWFKCRRFKDRQEYIAALVDAHKRFPEEPNFLCWIIEQRMVLADKEGARAALDEYLKRHPGSWEGLNLRARCADKLERDYVRSLRATESMAVLYPDSWKSWMRCSYSAATMADEARAGYYFSQMNASQQSAFVRGMTEAREAAERARELNDRDADVHVKLIGLYRENSMPQQAEEAFRQAIAVDPGRVDAYDALASMYGRGYENDEKRRIAICKQALEVPAKTWPRIQRQAEIALYDLEDKDKAMKLYQKAFAVAGKFSCGDLHESYAQALGEEMGRWAEAEKHARLALQEEANVTRYLILAGVLHELKRSDEALPYVQKAKQLEPDNPYCDAAIAALQEGKGNLDQALKTMEKVHQREPRSVEFLGNMLDGYLTKGDYDKAWEIMEEIKGHPNWEDADIELLDVGDIHALKGQFEDAITYYDLNLEKKPGHVKSLTRGALCYMMLDDAKRAAERWRKVLAKDPEHAESHMGLAACLQKLGDKQKSIAEARKAIAADAKVADPAYLAKECHWPRPLTDAARRVAAAARGK